MNPNRLVPRKNIHRQTLPIGVRSRDGAIFDPRGDRWTYREVSRTISLDFTGLPCSDEIKDSFKATLIWYAENRSSHHLKNMYERFIHMLRSMAPERIEILEITDKLLLSYRSRLVERQRWYLGSLSGFLKKWYSLGFAGITEDANALLRDLRIPGNMKGEAILTMDPEDGPYSDLEFEAILSALSNSFESGLTSLEEYVLVWLFMALGQRSIQYAALKLCDLRRETSSDGGTFYLLRIPRAKQRGVSRAEFKDRFLIQDMGEKLIQHQCETFLRFSKILLDPGSAPLFPAKVPSMDEPPGFEFHQTSASIASVLRAVLNRLEVTSERTGDLIHVTATRFRRTLGTRAAVEGHGELVIAELLDHSDTQNSGVYVQAVPAIIERIDRAVAMNLAPLAQAFRGMVIQDESEALRAGDATSRILDPRFDKDLKPMGSCGKYGYCEALAPIACYTCRNFQPWLDGPHDAVLDHLIAERERLLDKTDFRIASVNDRTILAVAEVVRQCSEVGSRNGRGHG